MVSIWLVQDADYRHNLKTGEAVPFLTYLTHYFKGDQVLRKDADEANLEDLVELCDQDAESVNAHGYCGAHRLLGAVLYRNLGREQATRVMREIAYRRGLHGMAGLCGLSDAFRALGVGKPGHGWSGTYGE